jgi:CubicO group peptidase (beta-lactamase class C family)
MRYLYAFLLFIAGACTALGGYYFLGPLPVDAIARIKAFSDDTQKDWLFQHTSELFPTRMIARGAGSAPLARDFAPPSRQSKLLDDFTFAYEGQTKTLRDLFTDMETSGLIITHKGNIIFEDYARGAASSTRFASFSLVKSFTSSLIGFAIKDGFIATVEDPLTQYLPDLVGTAYDGVRIRHALQMSSGVRFDDDVTERTSDTLNFVIDSAFLGKRRAYDIAKSFPRVAAPGTRYNYNTAESQILLELVRRVTGKTASQYMSEKLWKPLGMAHDATWVIDRPGAEGVEMGGAFFDATLQDWARYGLFIEQGGVWNNQPLLPSDWVEKATQSTELHLLPGKVEPHKNWRKGYGWHWWTFADGTFQADGSNGQSIFISQAHDLVITHASAWESDWVKSHDDTWHAFYDALMAWLETQ